MNRPIKFRVYSSPKMHYSDSFAENIEDFIAHWRVGDSDMQGFMQFTGLHDKNGVEVYEGDIVRYGNKESGIITWVEYHINSFELCQSSGIEDGKIPLNDPMSAIIDWQSIEVIGNIYENPELLTQTEPENE